jgi:hypothetical protein
LLPHPYRAASSPKCSDTFRASFEASSALKIDRCLSIKAIPVHDDTPAEISTSYVERQNLTLRMGSKRFARLSNGFDCHLAAVSLGARHAACRRES